MGILVKKQLIEGDRASKSIDSTTADVDFFIKFDTPQSGALQAIASGDFAIGQPHPQYNSLSLENVTASPYDAYNWTFTASYSLAASVDNPNTQTENKRDSVSFSSWSFQRVSAVLLNTAGDPIDPPPVKEVFFPAVSVGKFEKKPNISHILNQGYFNSSAFTLVGITVPPYCAQFASYTTEELVEIDENGREWVSYKNTYTIKLNFSKSESEEAELIGFQPEYLNAGFNTKKAEGGKKSIINLNTGDVFDIPQMLSVDGLSTVEEPNFILHIPKETFDFNSLGLPTSFPRQRN